MTVGRNRAALAVAGVAMLASGCSSLFHTASLTFTIANMDCGPGAAAKASKTVCSFLAYYGNISGKDVQVEPGSTVVFDKSGQRYAPVVEGAPVSAFLLKPGHQQGITWSVTLPVGIKPVKVVWHGSNVSVQYDPAAASLPPLAEPSAAASVTPSTAASVAPSVSPSVAPSVVPSTTPAPPTSPSVTPTTTKTTTKPRTTPTKVKAKAKPKSSPTVKVTSTPPTTPPVTHQPPRIHRTITPTIGNSTNPGGGSGGIG